MNTRNPSHGFYSGLSKHHSQATAQAAWDQAVSYFVNVYGMITIDAVNLLDSAHGRRIADTYIGSDGKLFEGWARKQARKIITQIESNRDLFEEE